MPFDGSGNYTPPVAPAFPAVAGTTITAAYYNQVINDLVTAMNNCLTRDGQGKPSTNISWNNKDLINVGTFSAVGASVGTITATASVSTVDAPYAIGWSGAVSVPTKNAVYNKIESVIASISTAVAGLMRLAGNLDCSANPNYPAGAVGDTYYVTVAGKIGGASGIAVDVGDAIVCRVVSAAGNQATVGANWFILEHNLQGALLSANNLSDLGNAGTARTNLGAAGSGAVTGSGLTMTATRLLGRITAATGAIEEITLGTGLAFSAGSLTVTGVPNALTFAVTGGVGGGAAYNGSTPFTVDYSTVGALPLTPRVQSVASATTVTPTFTNDLVDITAQAAGLTLVNPTGTAVANAGIVIRIKDNGTARTIAFDTQYRAVGVTLPSTTIISKTMYLGMIYNANATKWDVVSVVVES